MQDALAAATATAGSAGGPRSSRIAFTQDFRGREEHAVGRRVRGWCDRHLRRSGHAGEELDPLQHGEVLMDRVVAMVDIGPAELAELHLERDRPVASGAQSPDVLSDQSFGCRDGGASSVDRNAFFEVEMDRMVPAAASVDIGPVLDFARLRDQEGDAVGVEGVRRLPIHVD